jgi:hypothetical protein
MAAIDMPGSPVIGDSYLAENGINYVWDGEKWVVKTEAASGVNLWDRDPALGNLTPIYNGDGVIIKDDVGAVKVTIDDIGINANGIVTASTFDVDSLPALP